MVMVFAFSLMQPFSAAAQEERYCNITAERKINGDLTFTIRSSHDFDIIWGMDMTPHIQYWWPEEYRGVVEDLRPDLRDEFYRRWVAWEESGLDITYETWMVLIREMTADYSIAGVDYVDIGGGMVRPVRGWAYEWYIDSTSEWQRGVGGEPPNSLDFRYFYLVRRRQGGREAIVTMRRFDGNFAEPEQFEFQIVTYIPHGVMIVTRESIQRADCVFQT
jgi:hypothetical protein